VFDELKAMIFGKRAASKKAAGFHADELQLAQAALMFHVVAADGIVTDGEKERLSSLLAEKFGLGREDTQTLINEARDADNEAVDLYTFTRTLKRELDQEAKIAIIRDLWQMVYADGEVHEFEDNIVWRIAELLDVEARERIALKLAVRDSKENG
jgi:uncharacterized tellurite resistance protein B-like protein